MRNDFPQIIKGKGLRIPHSGFRIPDSRFRIPAPLTHLAKHTILAKVSGLNLKSGSHLLALLHIIV